MSQIGYALEYQNNALWDIFEHDPLAENLHSENSRDDRDKDFIFIDGTDSTGSLSFFDLIVRVIISGWVSFIIRNLLS